VAISVPAEIEGGVLYMRGRATVPNGAWVIYAAYRAAETERRVMGYVRAKDQRFTAPVGISRWPPGEIRVDAHFQVSLLSREQPDTVIARFGRDGERMSGKDIVEGGGDFQAAVASAKAVKRK
tara:strand:+ start:161 stop:529 length:369 start_codon:yes stop_codon:yes gene_type:complete